jgi:protein ImuB
VRLPALEALTVANTSHAADAPSSSPKNALRPAFLLARPEPIDVIAEVPDGPPAQFIWRRVERRVARAEGPERIAPEWWRTLYLDDGQKQPRTRDYYKIEDQAGAAYWVFRHGLFAGEEASGPPSWFLHGLFA